MYLDALVKLCKSTTNKDNIYTHIYIYIYIYYILCTHITYLSVKTIINIIKLKPYVYTKENRKQ